MAPASGARGPKVPLGMSDLRAALRFARRELRGGLTGFRILVACLALGVAAIAGVNSLSQAIEEALRNDARQLAGGDVVVRTTYSPASEEQEAWLAAGGTVARSIEMRAMGAAGGRNATETRRTLVELKGVDGAYPVYGAIGIAPAQELDAALGRHEGRWGAAVDPVLLHQLGIAIGDTIRVGDLDYVVRATVEREPDRVTSLFSFGPRLMVAADSLAETGLIRPGSLVQWHYHVRLPAGEDAHAFAETLNERFPDAAWRIRTHDEAAPGLRRMLDRLTLFLTLVGVTALLVGGIGVANAVRSYLNGKVPTIATMKCIGAPARVVFLTYFLQVMTLALLGIAIGIVLGALVPLAAADLLARLLPVAPAAGLYPDALALAALFGLLTAIVFSLLPLARAQELPPAVLFRDLVSHGRALPGWPAIAATLTVAALLAAVVIATAPEKRFAAWFIAGAAGSLLLFLGAAMAVVGTAAAAPRARLQAVRLAVSNLSRPGTATISVILSLGFGVTVLAAVALIENSLSREVRQHLPESAPSYFFIDLQPDQADRFETVALAVPGVDQVQRMPHLRARITKIDGVPVDQAQIAQDVRWAVSNERGLTYAASPPPGTDIVAGEWWPADYDGPLAISLDANLARGFGVGIGDTLSFNVLGRELEARIANLRRIEWTDVQLQFAVIFAPGMLAQAPHTFVATVHAEPAAEAPLVRAVTDAFPNVSAIRVRDALEAVGSVLDQIGVAVRSTAGITLLAGGLVLAGAVAAGQRRRIYEAVVLKVLGATRGDIMRAWLAEFLLLGLVTGLIGAALGTLTAWVVVTYVMGLPWSFAPSALAGSVLGCVAITLALGFVGVWRALGQKAAPLLRHP